MARTLRRQGPPPPTRAVPTTACNSSKEPQLQPPPMVTVLLPVKKGGHNLLDTVQSVIVCVLEMPPEWPRELLVIDDGSVDVAVEKAVTAVAAAAPSGDGNGSGVETPGRTAGRRGEGCEESTAAGAEDEAAGSDCATVAVDAPDGRGMWERAVASVATVGPLEGGTLRCEGNLTRGDAWTSGEPYRGAEKGEERSGSEDGCGRRLHARSPKGAEKPTGEAQSNSGEAADGAERYRREREMVKKDAEGRLEAMAVRAMRRFGGGASHVLDEWRRRYPDRPLLQALTGGR